MIESQRGALNKFFAKEPQASVENENVANMPTDSSVPAELNVPSDANVFVVSNLPDDASVPIENDDVDNVRIDNDIAFDMPVEEDNIDDVSIENDINIDDISTKNDIKEQTLASKTWHFPDIYDPRTWDGLDSKLIDL